MECCLAPADFAPWVDSAEAARKGVFTIAVTNLPSDFRAGLPHVRQLAKVRLPETEPIPEAGREPGPDSGDGRPIGVETEEAAIRVAGGQDSFGVATTAQRGVHVPAPGGRGEQLDDLVGHHRDVRECRLRHRGRLACHR